MCYEIGDRIKDEKRDLIITDKKYFTQGNRKTWYYKYHCNICGYDCNGGYRNGKLVEPNWYDGYSLKTKKTGCACCSHSIIVPKINSIRATNPELSKYFQNDSDIKYSIFSNSKADLVCPFCGAIKKNMTISSLFRQGFGCPVCSDKASLGERIIYYILQQLDVDFKKEFMFDDSKWRYDFYVFKSNAIIEVHGGQHYKQTTYGDLLSNQENDKLKKEFALNKGVSEYIVIDARKSSFDYIVNSIINSKFNDLCDLSCVNWNKIREALFSQNIQEDICRYWETHKDVTYVDMENIFKLSEATIRRYLQIGYELGWCCKDDRNKKHCGGNKNDTIPIVYVPKNMFFKSVGQLSKMSEQVIGKRIPSSTIRYKIKRNSQEFKYITKEEFNSAFYNNECCYGTPFDEKLL